MFKIKKKNHKLDIWKHIKRYVQPKTNHEGYFLKLKAKKFFRTRNKRKRYVQLPFLSIRAIQVEGNPSERFPTYILISAQKVLFLTLFLIGFERFLCTNYYN